VRTWPGLVALSVVIGGAGCSAAHPEFDGKSYTAPAPGSPWKPASGEVPTVLKAERPPPLPAALQAPAATPLTSAELIDAALQINPSTRAAWENARAAAAAWAASRGRYYPSVGAGMFAQYAHGGVPTEFDDVSETIQGVGAATSYLLLDFGGRSATVEAARQALIAANWTQNRTIQAVVYQVARTYYDLVGSEAEVRAAETSLQEALTSVRATQERLKTGVGTIADVLQAQSDEAQRRLDLVTVRGQARIDHGALATAVGWAANTEFSVAEPADAIPVDAIRESVDELIARAEHDRPDLAAGRAAVLQAEAGVRVAESALWPRLVGGASVERKYVQDGSAPNATSYLFGLGVEIPIFEGFALVNAVREARANVDASRARLQTLSEAVMNDVWKAYYDFRTAADQVQATEALFASAAESFRVWSGLYRGGAADIVELLNAQTLLARARAEVVRTHTALYRSYAAVVFAVGARPGGLGAETRDGSSG